MSDMFDRQKELENHMKGVMEIFDAITNDYDSLRHRLLCVEKDNEALRRTLFEGVTPSVFAEELGAVLERIEKSPHEHIGWYEQGLLSAIARDVEALEHRAGKMERILREVRTLLVYAGADDCVVAVSDGDETRTIDAADIIGRIDELGIEAE
jgi:hypothetical protein